MGELAVSSATGHVLTALGLGSCIGLALVDRRMGLAGLAHIVLPAADGHGSENPRKFADHAVPDLVSELEALGARRVRLQAALAGGATMFATSSPALEIGPRNEAAVREQLGVLQIRVAAAATGGRRGRTIRVHGPEGAITVREAGGTETTLLEATS